MLAKMKKSFDEGVEKIRWFSSLFAERIKVEMAVFKILRESRDLERRRAELAQGIGERVFEMREHRDLNPLEDRKVVQALREMETLDKELTELRSRASQISQVVEEE
ncbi:MAG: hypothetical protein P8Y39_03735 [Nitrospirota bacterium]|jgi:predicted transcriptional regulator